MGDKSLYSPGGKQDKKSGWFRWNFLRSLEVVKLNSRETSYFNVVMYEYFAYGLDCKSRV